MHPFIKKMNHYINTKHGHVNILLQLRYGVGMIYNYFRYEATISDYFELAFYNKSHNEKKKYITSPQALRFAAMVDSMEDITHYFSKKEMYRALQPYILRHQVFTDECSYEDFIKFASEHKKCIYKPDKDDCGHGIEVWEFNKDNIDEKFKIAKATPAVLDEIVVQHEHFALLNPTSVNSVRLYTLIVDGQFLAFAGFIRMGRNGAIVDNLGSGGLLAGIDIVNGVVCTPATDDIGIQFEVHPDTGTKIIGFVIDNWQELLKFVEEAAFHYPMKYVGWDIAVCEDGFQIIEANPDPMIHGIQTEFFGGRKEQFEAFEKMIKETRKCHSIHQKK